MGLAFGGVWDEFYFAMEWGETSVSTFDSYDWAAVGSATASMLLGAGLLFVLSVACVSPSASNRAFLPRLYITVAIVLSYFVMLYTAVEFDELEVMLAWFFGWFALLLVATLISSGERRDPGMRVLHSRLMRRRLTRPIGFLLSSNAFAGLAWCAVMTGVLVVGLVSASDAASLFTRMSVSHWGSWEEDVAQGSLGVTTSMGMAIAFNLLAIALRDGPLKRFSKGPVMTPAITMLLIAAVSIFPPIAVALMGNSRGMDAEGLSLLNPVSSLIWYESEMHGLRLMLAGVMLVVGLLACSRVIGRTIRAYRDRGPDHDGVNPLPRTDPDPVATQPVITTQADPDA